MFVADDLAAWLIGVLADTGRKKLTSLVLGDEQERALRSAARAAVQRTAEELCPGDQGQAEHVALVVSQVFGAQVSSGPLAGHEGMLGALHAGIARQLVVLDDASLTGTGQSSAEVLGLSSAAVAQRLTGHLVGEILVRGSRGGPLFAMASQLNDDMTHLQGQRIEEKLDRLASMIRAELTPFWESSARQKLPNASSLPSAQYWPRVADVDPLVLGVHRTRSGKGEYSLLPPYVCRDVDKELRDRLTVASKHGGWVLLIGDSTAGKTRAAFEAMRQVLPDYRVLAPPRDADLSSLAHLVGESADSRLLWLDDMQSYLRPGGFDEILMSALTKRGVVIMATLRSDVYEARWRNLQHSIVERGGVLYAAVLNLVEPVEIARQWSPTELDRTARESDERLRDAVANHGSHGIAEYLAAGPELVLEWHQASRVGGHPRGAALVGAAIDLARIGLDGPLPERLLRRVHQDYLERTGGATLRPETFANALKWAAQVRYGATSLLIPGDAKGTWRAFEYIIAEENRNVPVKQIPEATWRLALAHKLSGAQRLSVAEAAYPEAGRRDFAEAALRPLAEAGNVWAMYNLGCLYAETEEITPLVEWFGGGSASLMARAERADEAEAWWRRAAGNGHVESMHNLGLLLLGRDRDEEANKWLDHADAREAERRVPLAVEDYGQSKALREAIRRLRSMVEPPGE